jgi:hypothetical protein
LLPARPAGTLDDAFAADAESRAMTRNWLKLALPA